MKTINKYILAAICTLTGISMQAQIKVDNTGNVGIGIGAAAPSAKLDVNGTTKLGGFVGIGLGTTSPTANLEANGTIKFNGNLGIGIAPTATDKLTVNGSSYFKTSPTGGFKMSYTTRTYYGAGGVQYIPILSSDNPSYSGIIGEPYSAFGVSFPIYEINAKTINYLTLYHFGDPVIIPKMGKVLKSGNTAQKLNLINVYQYESNEQSFSSQNTQKSVGSSDKTKRMQTGLMAKELEEVFPELVTYNAENDVYGINYIGFIPHLIQAMQDQSREIETLKTELAYYQSNCCSDTKTPKENASTHNDGSQARLSNAVSAARLDQNIPNPFTQETRIAYFIPKQAQAASLFVYDLQGKQLKHIVITPQGEGSTTIQGREFKAGMYMYSLVVDNELVDTKRMILTE